MTVIVSGAEGLAYAVIQAGPTGITAYLHRRRLQQIVQSQPRTTGRSPRGAHLEPELFSFTKPAEAE